ncbi:MAG: general secretion pathway protein GspB [Pseudomonadota bacterium]
MSLLLEALQRADSERKNQGDVPGIDTPHAAASPVTPERSHQWVLIALTLVTLLLLVYVIYLQTSGTQSNTLPVKDEAASVEDTEAGQNRQQSVSTSQNSVPAASIAPAASDEQTKRKPSQADVAALYERLQAQGASDLVNEGPDSSATAVTALPTADITQYSVGENEAQDAVIDQQNAAEEVYSSIPYASQLSVQQQDSIPSLRYTTHGYAAATGKGLVTLNGRSQRRGDTIAPGLVLLDIRADYIVLDMNGVLFRLPAASDWN